MADIDKRWTDTRFVWNKLGYDKDAIVEASAGTGKTFALESIVLKLICEKEYDAKEILLVTFTDKAAAELKDRVRKALEKENQLPPDFDEMTICTIHSFCRQLLSEFAFENGVPMQCDIGGDGKALIHRAVMDALKSPRFADECSNDLFTTLKKAGFDSVNKLFAKAKEIVEKDGIGNLDRKLHEKETELKRELAAALRDIHCGSMPKDIAKRAEFKTGTKTGKASKDFFDWLGESFDLLCAPEKPGFADCLARFPEGTTPGHANPAIVSWDGQSVKKGSLSDMPGMDGCETSLGNLVRKIKDLVKERDRLQEGSSADIRKKKLLIALATMGKERFEELKKAAALLPFDDMVARAAEIVRKKPGTPAEKDTQKRFFKAVREHWRVALVDEFQDTDGNQWDIFRTLFSASENKVDGAKPGFLIVVGDPKQAIYSFRGADVRVYCAAQKAIMDGGGEKQTLHETFRAKPKLVDAFNGFFSDGWFADGAAGESIPYDAVRYPEDGNEKFGDKKDDKGNRGRGLVDEAEPDPVRLLESIPARMRDAPPESGAFGNADVCLPVFMENAACEMKRLHDLDPAYRMDDKDGNLQPHRFRYRDMCVLVKAKDHAIAVRRALSRHGIPFGQYKQPGLFDSPEAEGVLALLDCVEKPNGTGNRAALLLSPVFGIKPARLPEFAAFPAFDAFIERLLEHARKREWSELFEAAMSDPCTALASPGGTDIHEFNRVRAAVRRIFDLLLAKRGRLARTVADFSSELRAWRKNDKSAGDDGELFGKDSDADRVQIMTMHASKGLEFPVVFVAAGFSAPFAKNKTPADEQPALREEIRRLFYVALTRAEHRIYLPWSKNAWESGIGTDGSPLLARSEDRCGFLGKAIQAWFDTEEKREHAFTDGGAAQATSATYTATASKQDEDGGARPAVEIPDSEVAKEGLKWKTSLRLQWNSFTSLHKKAKKDEAKKGAKEDKPPHVAQGTGLKDPKEDDELDDDPETKKSLLPGGNICGNVFHETMEALCKNNEADGQVGFTNAHDPGKETGLLDLIREKMRANSVKPAESDDGTDSTEKAFLRMVRHALDMELVFGDCRFKLREIPRKDRCAETEFVVSEKADGILNGRLPEYREGAFNGSIDLLVRVGKKVFVIDWKTNSLTKYDDPRERRGRSHVETAMDEAGYHLQYQLYALATAAWLEGHGETLAGVAYLFVRAHMEGVANDVFSMSVDDAVLEEFRGKVLSNPAVKA